MVRGSFRSFCHDHFFEALNGTTLMKDVMQFAAPFPPVGLLAERLVLRRHMGQLLLRRNQRIQRVAESDEWRQYL
jgi:ligand-binding SRPBCC domain-containing protein